MIFNSLTFVVFFACVLALHGYSRVRRHSFTSCIRSKT